MYVVPASRLCACLSLLLHSVLNSCSCWLYYYYRITKIPSNCLYYHQLSFYVVVLFCYITLFQYFNDLKNIIFSTFLHFITYCFTALYTLLSVIFIAFIILIII